MMYAKCGCKGQSLWVKPEVNGRITYVWYILCETCNHFGERKARRTSLNPKSMRGAEFKKSPFHKISLISDLIATIDTQGERDWKHSIF